MGHIIRMQSREQYVAVVRVLEKLPGMWHTRGPASAPTLMVLDSHYAELVKEGIILSNGKEEKADGKKTARKNRP